jgi:hypothetical protein
MTELPRVLVGITTYEAKDYIFHECMKHVYNINYPQSKFDVVIVDNSAKADYFYKLKRRGYKGLYRVERGENSREAITKAQNKIRKILLEGDYEYLFFVESDLLVPPDIIQRLLSYNKPVVGSVYNIARDSKFVPCIFIDDIMKDGFRGTRPLGVKHVPNGSKIYDPKEIGDFFGQPGPIQSCHGVGFGATMIRKDVVEHQAFWHDIRFDDKHSDVYFYLDLSRRRIPVFVDITVTVPHHPSDWSRVLDR